MLLLLARGVFLCEIDAMELPSQRRIVVTGTTGIGKAGVVERLCQHICDTEPGRTANWYAAEQTLRMDAFLDARTNRQARICERALTCYCAICTFLDMKSPLAKGASRRTYLFNYSEGGARQLCQHALRFLFCYTLIAGRCIQSLRFRSGSFPVALNRRHLTCRFHGAHPYQRTFRKG